jgi:hypothetical protein
MYGHKAEGGLVMLDTERSIHIPFPSPLVLEKEEAERINASFQRARERALETAMNMKINFSSIEARAFLHLMNASRAKIQIVCSTEAQAAELFKMFIANGKIEELKNVMINEQPIGISLAHDEVQILIEEPELEHETKPKKKHPGNTFFNKKNKREARWK